LLVGEISDWRIGLAHYNFYKAGTLPIEFSRSYFPPVFPCKQT
jgi:hypothetical protein